MCQAVFSRLILTVSLLFWGIWVQAAGTHEHHAHESASSTNSHWTAPKAEAQRPNPIPRTPESVTRGKALFAKNCSECHGAEGKGDGPAAFDLAPTPADLTQMANQHPDGDFFWKITQGRGSMPAWKETLSEKERWDLVNFIQSLGRNSAPQK